MCPPWQHGQSNPLGSTAKAPPLAARSMCPPWQHGQCALLGSTLNVPSLAAPGLGSCASSGHAWRLCGSSALPGVETQPLGAQPLPRALELAASKAANFTGCDPPG